VANRILAKKIKNIGIGLKKN